MYYTVKDICEKFEFSKPYVYFRIYRLKLKPTFRKVSGGNRERIFTESEVSDILDGHNFVTVPKNKHTIEVIYITQTFVIYPSKINGL